MAAGATAAAKEQCRTLVLATQELAKNLTKPEQKRMANNFAEQAVACVSTSGAPLSMLAPDSWVKCFVEFFYGDAVPNMKERGMKGNGTVHVPLQDIFQWLQDREELEYMLPSDAVPYRARATSRFDTPEGTAIFGSVLRYELILQGVGTVFRRQGYEADLKMIAKAKPEECVEALCNGFQATRRSSAQGVSAAKPDRHRGLDQLAYAPDVPENLRTALKQVLFAQVKVPFTDGYRRKLRHEGHNLNAVHGPLKLFVTANFADVYSPVLLSMLLKNSDGNPVADPVEVSWADLAAQCPEMCTLQEMHRRVAASPRTQAKFWLLMDDLVDRYLLAIGHYYVGPHRSACVINYMAIEDDYCSSGELGLAGFAINDEEPCEAQARGFTHGHRKVYGIPEPMGPEILRQFQAISASNPENAVGVGDSVTARQQLLL